MRKPDQLGPITMCTLRARSTVIAKRRCYGTVGGCGVPDFRRPRPSWLTNDNWKSPAVQVGDPRWSPSMTLSQAGVPRRRPDIKTLEFKFNISNDLIGCPYIVLKSYQ